MQKLATAGAAFIAELKLSLRMVTPAYVGAAGMAAGSLVVAVLVTPIGETLQEVVGLAPREPARTVVPVEHSETPSEATHLGNGRLDAIEETPGDPRNALATPLVIQPVARTAPFSVPLLGPASPPTDEDALSVEDVAEASPSLTAPTAPEEPIAEALLPGPPPSAGVSTPDQRTPLGAPAPPSAPSGPARPPVAASPPREAEQTAATVAEAPLEVEASPTSDGDDEEGPPCGPRGATACAAEPVVGPPRPHPTPEPVPAEQAPARPTTPQVRPIAPPIWAGPRNTVVDRPTPPRDPLPANAQPPRPNVGRADKPEPAAPAPRATSAGQPTQPEPPGLPPQAQGNRPPQESAAPSHPAAGNRAQSSELTSDPPEPAASLDALVPPKQSSPRSEDAQQSGRSEPTSNGGATARGPEDAGDPPAPAKPAQENGNTQPTGARESPQPAR